MVREGDAETIWARLHARQAFVFGFVSSLSFVILLSLPLVAVIVIPTISPATTIAVYSGGLIADAIAALFFVFLAVRYSARAARGELFAIPLVTPIVDSIFRLHRP